jgi:hypothetical protein
MIDVGGIVAVALLIGLVWLLFGRPKKAEWRPGSTDHASPRRRVDLEDAPRYSPTPIITDRRSAELDRELERWEREQQERGDSRRNDPEPLL